MKIINAASETPGMTREEAEKFLESKLNLQLATVDKKGDPNIHPSGFTTTKIKKNLDKHI